MRPKKNHHCLRKNGDVLGPAGPLGEKFYKQALPLKKSCSVWMPAVLHGYYSYSMRLFSALKGIGSVQMYIQIKNSQNVLETMQEDSLPALCTAIKGRAELKSQNSVFRSIPILPFYTGLNWDWHYIHPANARMFGKTLLRQTVSLNSPWSNIILFCHLWEALHHTSHESTAQISEFGPRSV